MKQTSILLASLPAALGLSKRVKIGTLRLNSFSFEEPLYSYTILLLKLEINQRTIYYRSSKNCWSSSCYAPCNFYLISTSHSCLSLINHLFQRVLAKPPVVFIACQSREHLPQCSTLRARCRSSRTTGIVAIHRSSLLVLRETFMRTHF